MECFYKIRFGSSDSLDDDVIYIVDSIPNIVHCKQFCSSDPSENRNLAVIEDGIVVDQYKGTSDELNNSIYLTFGLHKQEIDECPVHRLIERDLIIKDARAIRCILSHCSRTQYRPVVKKALKSMTIIDRLDALQEIDLRAIKDFDKNDIIEVHKTIAFQLAQAMALHLGVELFTKKQSAEIFESLRPYLYRCATDIQALEHSKNWYIEYLRNNWIENDLNSDGAFYTYNGKMSDAVRNSLHFPGDSRFSFRTEKYA